AGCEALRRGSPALLDLATAQLKLRAFSFSRRKRESAQTLLYDFAGFRPEATTQLMLELARGSNPRKWLFRAMGQPPSPVNDALVDHARNGLSDDDAAVQELALLALKKHGVRAEPRALLHQHFEAPPVAGPPGIAARVFAEAAQMLAEAGVLGGAE